MVGEILRFECTVVKIGSTWITENGGMKHGPVKFRVIRNLDYFLLLLHWKNHDQEIHDCTVYDWNFHEFGDLHKFTTEQWNNPFNNC